MSTKATPPPAYFLSLSLENVRSFGEKQTIYFTEGGKPEGRPAQWTIILGDNGVGKTTVLKALAALQPIEDVPYNKDVSVPAFNVSWRRKWWPVRHDGAETAFMSFRSVSGWGFTAPTKSYMSPAPIDICVIGTKTDEYREYTLLTQEYYKINGQLLCYGYGASRNTGNSTISETPEIIDTCASLFDERADLLNPEEWFLFADYRVKSDKNPLTIQNLNLITKALLDIMSIGDITDISVAPVMLEGGSPRQGLRFKTPYGWVRLRELSLGYQILVVWITDFASKLFIRYPGSANPLEQPAIALIDEIDLHLHPRLQREFMSLLSRVFTNTQFIATAHSPLVVQAAGDAKANVVLLKREGDQTKVYQGADLPDVRRWRVDQILSSELFDEVPARSPDTEQRAERRDALLAKRRLTTKEKEELAQLDRDLQDQPVGSTAGERQAADVLRELARKLGKSELLD